MSKTTRKEIAQAVLDKLQKKSAQQVAAELASYLVSERRSKDLIGILRDMEQLQYDQRGVLEVTASSAHELSESVKKQIEKLLAAKQVHVHYQQDASVVGGVRVQALDQQFDSTIDAKLRRLKLLTTKGV